MKLRAFFACYCLIFSTRCHASNQKQSGWSFWPTTQKSNPSLSKSFPSDDWTDLGGDDDMVGRKQETSQYCNPHKNDNQQPVFYDNPMQHQANNIEKNREKDFLSLPIDLQESIKNSPTNHSLKKTVIASKVKSTSNSHTPDSSMPSCNKSLSMIAAMNIERNASTKNTSCNQNKPSILQYFFIKHCCGCLPQINHTEEASKKKINR